MKMPKLLITIDNQTREMTDDEYAEYLQFCKDVVAVKKAEEKELNEKNSAKESAIEKLAALGLTPGEANAIVGN